MMNTYINPKTPLVSFTNKVLVLVYRDRYTTPQFFPKNPIGNKKLIFAEPTTSGYFGADEDGVMNNIFNHYAVEVTNEADAKTGQKVLYKDGAQKSCADAKMEAYMAEFFPKINHQYLTRAKLVCMISFQSDIDKN